jgi:hypothetical protein
MKLRSVYQTTRRNVPEDIFTLLAVTARILTTHLKILAVTVQTVLDDLFRLWV